MYAAGGTSLCLHQRNFCSNENSEWRCAIAIIHRWLFACPLCRIQKNCHRLSLYRGRINTCCFNDGTGRMKKNYFLCIAMMFLSSLAHGAAEDSLRWDYRADVNFYLIPNDFFVLPVFAADKNKLHLEA